MSVIKINQFGGEMPSISSRNLPASAARTSKNLLLSLAEFRPLSNDAVVAAAPAGTRTLYRMAREAGGDFNSDPSTGWITATSDRSYVKGQIDDELTERTYVTFDDGSAKPRAINASGADRVLGVPRPTKLVPVHTVVDELTSEEASTFLSTDVVYQIQQAIPSALSSELSGRREGALIYAGPTDLTGALFSDDPALASLNLAGDAWNLFFPLTAARVTQMKASSMTQMHMLADGSYAASLICVPWTVRLTVETLTASLLAIVQPASAGATAGSPLFTADQAARIVADLQNAVSVEALVSIEKSQLEQMTNDYRNALFDSVVVDDGNDDEIWAIQRSITDIYAATNNITHSIEDKMQSALTSLLTGSTVANVLGAMGGAADFGITTTERILDDRFYIATFVTDWGEESEPSEPSDLVPFDQNDLVSIPRPTVTGGESFAARNIAKWRVYRTNAGLSSASFQFVGEVLVSAASFADTKKGSELGEVCPTVAWLQPPYRMNAQSDTYPTPVSGSNPYLRGLVGMPNGIMAGFFDNTVAFCEPYVPYAWPVEYQISTEFPIVGLGVFGQTLFVGTTGNPYFISGADSASMSAQKLDSNQACVSRKSICAVQGGVLFASPDGLCVAEPNGVTVISSGLYTREDWQALSPATMFAADHENIYYLFHNSGCLAFDLSSKKLGHVDLQADAVFVDRLTDTMYVASGTSISAVFGGAARRTGLWKSGKLVLPAQAPFAWLQVDGEQTVGVPVTVRWYGDGVLRHTATVTGIAPMRLPPGRWLEHEIEIESAARLTKVMFAGHTLELQQA